MTEIDEHTNRNRRRERQKERGKKESRERIDQTEVYRGKERTERKYTDSSPGSLAPW